jgi:hypothetical protein
MKFDRRTLILAAGAVIAAVLLVASILVATGDKADSPVTIDPTLSTRGTILVKFEGSPSRRQNVMATFEIDPQQSAWIAVQKALGPANLKYRDFGGDLGIFITGFYGVEATGDHFWEFFVNGKSSEVGVSSYIVKDGDVLEFRYS